MAPKPTFFARRGAQANAARADLALMENGDHSAVGGGLDQVRNLTHLAVRHALTGARSGIRRNDALAECLRAACSEARDAGLHVEDVIVMIKQAWRSLAESHALSHRDDESALNGVVTSCINEYYRDGDEGRRQ